MGMAQDPRRDVLPFARRLAVALCCPTSFRAFFDRAALVLSVARQRIVARHQSCMVLRVRELEGRETKPDRLCH
jgi:hypothetical protein